MQDVSREPQQQTPPSAEGSPDGPLACWSHRGGPLSSYPLPSGDGSKAPSQSPSTGSSVVLSPHDAGGGRCVDAKSSSTSNSSSSSCPLLKEHDYIGLGEVSSSSVRKHACEDEKCGTENVNFNFAETDLRLGLGPPEATDFSSVDAQHASKFASQGSALRAQGLPCLALGSTCHDMNHGDRGWVSEQKRSEASEMPSYASMDLPRNSSCRAPTQPAQNGSRSISAWPERSFGLNEGNKLLQDERAKPEGQREKQMAPDSRASQELHFSSQMGSWPGRDGRIYVNESGSERRSHVFPDSCAGSNHFQAAVLRSTRDAPAPQQSGQDFDSSRSLLLDSYAGSRLVLQPSRNGVKRGYSEAMADSCYSSGELKNGVCDGGATGSGVALGVTAAGAFSGAKGGMQLSEIEVKQLSQSGKNQPALYPVNWPAVKPTSATPWQIVLEHNGGPLGPFGCLQSKHSGSIPKHPDTSADSLKAAWDSRENVQEGFRSLENPQSQANLMENQQSLHSDAPPSKGQVVGWPPIGSFRKNKLSAHPSVKVNMDGVPYGRKLDLNAYSSYDELSHALEGMFQRPTTGQGGSCDSNQLQLHNGSEYTLTYEDKDGDWMLVGDVPWGMFVNTVRRLRIMKGSDATGLAPGGSEKSKCRSEKSKCHP